MNYITGTRIITVSRPDKRINAFLQGGTITSFSLPAEITSIAPHAFDNIAGLTEIVFANQEEVVDVSPLAGIAASVKFVVPEQLLDGYESAYPEREIVSYETGYEWVVPFIGETTLTAAYVNQCLMQNPEAKKAKKVVVPSGFTNYEAGAIQAVENQLDELNTLIVNEFHGGTLEINKDVMDKIKAIGKTLDGALVYAKETYTEDNYSCWGDAPAILWSNPNLIILPPVSLSDINASGVAKIMLDSCPNLVQAEIIDLYGYHIGKKFFNNCPNLVSIKVTGSISLSGVNDGDMINGNSSSLKYVVLNGMKLGMKVSFSTAFTRQTLIGLINSLGTPETTKTLTIGATNLAKLTAEDIQIAEAKNWQLA